MTSSGRTIYDGFATIRANGSSTNSKNKRARSSPPGGQKGVGGNGCGGMGPLWEEKASPRKVIADAPVARRERAQWWDIATRRSRYRSCPAFSQASVISAVEQTVSSVSDRLERLASSPDLKAAEADELRKTVVTLRKQSSVMSQSLCNGFSLPERDVSCDSVDSLISSVSGNHQHHHGKRHNFHRCNGVIGEQQTPQREITAGEQQGNTKKRSWLRNSFRRAFGRKRSKQSHTSSPQRGEAPPPTSPSIFSSQWRHNTLNSFRSSPSLNNCRNSLSHNPNLSINPNQLVGDRSSVSSVRNSGLYSSDSSTMRDSAIYSASEAATLLRKSFQRCSKDSSLEVQLSEKQKELTDCQLELLATQHQLQTKTDLIDTLEAEVRSLKTENSELTSLFRERFGAASDALLTQTLSRMNLAQHKAEKPLSSKSLGKSLRVTVVEAHCGLSKPMQCRTDSNSRTHIGHVTIAPKTSWQHLDNLIYSVVKDFNSQVNPSGEYSPPLPPLIPSDSSSNHIYSKLKDIADSSSESSRSSLKSSSPFSSLLFCYRLAEVVRSPSLGVPELLPYGYCVGEVEEVALWLRGGQQRPEGENLSEKESQALSFATNLPTEVLTRLTGQLLSSRRLVVCGPPNSGKTSLCKAIAKHYVSTSHSPTLHVDETIKHFTATRSNSFELSQLLSYPRGVSAPSVIIVDDAHCSTGLTDTLLNSLRSYNNVHTAIIVCGSKPSAYFSQLSHHLNFRCEELSPSSEPLKGLLGRILRKNLLCNEVSQRKSIPEARLIVDWLQRLLFHLNEHLSRVTEPPNRVNEQPTSYFSPTEFIDCPIGDLAESQRWFLTTWNEKIIPVLRSFSRSSHQRYQSFSLPEQSEDPSEWVIATYPWPSLPDCGPQHLARLFPEKKIMMTSYASLSRVGSRGTESIYAVPSIDRNAGYRTISSSTVRNHRKYIDNGYSRATDGVGITVPSSMALIAPYKAPNTFAKPPNTFTKPLLTNGDSGRPLNSFPSRNGVNESNGGDSKNFKRMSRSSDDMLDNTECSSSSGSVSSDPIYSTIRREDKVNGTSSKFQGAFDRIAADQRRYMNVTNDGITDAIIYAGKYRSEKAKDISYELTSTFKPVETSM